MPSPTPPPPTIHPFDYSSIFLNLWPLWVTVVVVKAFPMIRDIIHMKRIAASGIEDIDTMDGRTFEQYLGTFFRAQGYGVEVTPYRGDWGADLVLVKGNVRTVVQAKRYKKRVGVRAIQEAVAAKAKYQCSEAMVVTNSTFTREATELARVNHVTLLDREALVSKLLDQKKKAA